MIGSYGTNTLRYDESRCSGCGLCVVVCPHGVFAQDGGAVRLAHGEACMECGACQRNCPTGAIDVDSGVGCATALLYAALTGREACCGPSDEPCRAADGGQGGGGGTGSCCGPSDEPCCDPGEAPGDAGGRASSARREDE